jgi:hypothetical protein
MKKKLRCWRILVQTTWEPEGDPFSPYEYIIANALIDRHERMA